MTITEFDYVFKEWVNETRFMSSISSMKELPQYKELITYEANKALLPILGYLCLDEECWMCAMILGMNYIGYNPVPPHFAGKIKIMRQFWIVALKERLGLFE